jgi:hypothetical protein
MAIESSRNDPAFPVAETHLIADKFDWTRGVSRLEWYAGQALALMHGSFTQGTSHRLLTMQRDIATKAEIEWAENVVKNVAIVAFDTAEAMIAENKRRTV